MPDYRGVNNTKTQNPIADNIVAPGFLGGNIKVNFDTYEASAVAATKTIAVGKLLPVGAKIMGVMLAFDDLGTGCTLSVGDSVAATRYRTNVDVASAAGNSFGCNVDGLGYVIGTNSGDNEILITVNTQSITGTIAIAVFYTEN